jgi:hypothetical protein
VYRCCHTPPLLTTCCLLSLSPLAHQIEPSKEGPNGVAGVAAKVVYIKWPPRIVVFVAVFREGVQEALEDIKVYRRIRIRMFIYLSLAFIAWIFL